MALNLIDGRKYSKTSPLKRILGIGTQMSTPRTVYEFDGSAGTQVTLANDTWDFGVLIIADQHGSEPEQSANVTVFVNGVRQSAENDYTFTTRESIVFGSAIDNGDRVVFEVY